MTRARKAAPDRVWWVRHPRYGTAVVSAPDWEQATVEAAKWWEVPWREVAALCECDRTETVTRNICVGCGVIFHGEGLFCSRCFTARRGEVLQCSARERRYFRSLMPRQGRGGGAHVLRPFHRGTEAAWIGGSR